MRLTRNGDITHVTLSERNVRQLIAAFELRPDEAYIIQRQPDGSVLRVSVEPDAKHYEGREPGPALDYLIKCAIGERH